MKRRPVNVRWYADSRCLALSLTWVAEAEGHAQVEAAKRVCARCYVAQDCLIAALREEAGQGYRERYGVRGGLSRAQRAGVR